MNLTKPSILSVLALGIAGVASASTPHNGWAYAIDSMNDGSGGSGYEYRGLAFRVAGNTATFAISGAMPKGGFGDSQAQGGRISHGDLFINLGSGNLDSASKFTSPNVLAVRFDVKNDSLGGGTALGVYNNITAASLTGNNRGYASLQAYNNAGFGRNSRAMGDLQSTTGDVKDYFGFGAMYPNFSAGTQVGGITLKSRTDLAAAGLDFGHFGADPSGNNVFGFSMDTSLLGNSPFTAHLFQECINDGMAIQAAVPEPGTLTALGLGALAFLRRRRKA